MRAAINAARIVAITIETGDDAGTLRKRAAAEALAAFAEAAEGLKLAQVKAPSLAIMRAIAADPASSGTIACPICAGRMSWAKDSSNGHIYVQCETTGCQRIIQ